MNLWMVTHGSYSDYSVDCVCQTEELAQQIAKALGEHEVEEVVAYDTMPRVIDRLAITGEVDPDDDAWSGRETHDYYLADDPEQRSACAHSVRVSSSYLSRNNHRQVIHIQVYGTDHVRVRKTFSEQLAQARADGPLIIAKDAAERAEREVKYLNTRIIGLTAQGKTVIIGS